MTDQITVATRYTLLRNLVTSCATVHEVPEEPLRVVTVVDEAKFIATGEMVHHKTVFFEDRLHDWEWSDGKFRYFARANDNATVALVYEEQIVEREPVLNFCPMCGAKLADDPDHQCPVS